MARALMLPGSGYKKVETLHKALQGDGTRIETIDVREIDVLMLRNDPSLGTAGDPGRPMRGRCSDGWRSRAACWS